MKRTNFILQAAVATAFGATAAHAANFAGAGPVFATEDLKGATSATTVTFPAVSHNTVVINGTETYINRVQTLNIKVTLDNGAKFAAAVPAPASGYVFGNFNSDGSLTTSAFATAAGGTIVSGLPVVVAAGGAAGDTFVTFSVDPTGVGLKKGGLDLGALVLKNIQSTIAAGSSVSADIAIYDSGTGISLEPTITKSIASGAAAVSFVVTPTASPAKIDVAQNSVQFTTANPNETEFDAGTVKMTLNTAYYLLGGTQISLPSVTDVELTVAGLTSFDAFAHAGGVYLGSAIGVDSIDANATPSTAAGASFSINTAGNITQLDGAGFHVYFDADGTTAIEEGTPTAAVTGGVVTGITGITALGATPLASMVKNGYTAKYPLVFAAGDSTLGTTYVRLVNNTSVAGKVYFTFKDKAGAVVGTANASVDVAAKGAFLMTDSDIEKLTGTLPTGAFYRLEISSTLPQANVVSQAYVLTPNMSISNITPEK